MSTRNALLYMLADGAFHSGTDLGEHLGVSRAAINKAVQQWVERGMDIHSVSGRGYRLGDPFVPLDEAAIRAQLDARGVALPVEVLAETDSTSQYLLRAANDGPHACLAESQSAGRGRRGRVWVTTPFRNILLSLRWRFDGGPATLTGLSLAAGVAVVRALESFGLKDAGLKWPNDVLLDGRKLAGLLVDVRGEAEGPALVVLGLGLNVHLAARDAAGIDQPWASLHERLAPPVDRNRLAALLIAELVEALRRYEREGFAPFRSEWERHHLYRDRPVSVHGAQQAVHGTALGVDERGALRVRDARGEVRSFYSGDVSLRAPRS